MGDAVLQQTQHAGSRRPRREADPPPQLGEGRPAVLLKQREEPSVRLVETEVAEYAGRRVRILHHLRIECRLDPADALEPTDGSDGLREGVIRSRANLGYHPEAASHD